MLLLALVKLCLLLRQFVASLLILGVRDLGALIVEPLFTILKLLEQSLFLRLLDIHLIIVVSQPVT